MNGKQLKNSILQWAIQGKLVPPVCRQAGKTLMTNPEPRDKGKECWFTYVIECEDGSFYKGFTDNLLRRYQQHCNGTGADYTKTHKPKQLYYWEMHYSKEAALQREKYLKSGAGREWFKKEVVDKPENFEPASVLLKRIRKEKERLIKEKKIKRDKNASIIYRGDDNSYYEKILATGEVKCIDDEVPFEIPKGWEWCRIRDLCTVFGRIGFRGYTRNDIVEKGFGAITLSPSNMQDNGNMNYSVVSYISWKKYEESPEIKIKANDVLIVKTGSSYGKTCIITDLPEKATINPQIAVLKYSFVNNLWLTYCLNAPFAQEQFRKYVIGTSIPTFSQEKLSSTLLPLPPKNEQEHLTKKLSLLDKWIGSYNGIQQFIDRLNMDIYYKLKKSILQEAIQGKLVPQIDSEGTAQELLQQIKAEKLKLVKEGKLRKSALNNSVIFRGDYNKYYEQVGKNRNDITDEIPFDLPYNWCWCRFSNIASMTIGKTPARGEQTYWINGKYNWVSISDMVDGGSISTTKEKVSDMAVKEVFSAPISEKGCLLMSFKLSIGKTSILDIDAYHNEAIITIRPFIDKEYAMKNYLFKVLPQIANSGESKDAIKGKTLNSKSLGNLLIPLPPLREQQRIIRMIEQLMQLLK